MRHNPEKPEPEGAKAPWSGKTDPLSPAPPLDILIVEDHPDTIELLHDVLKGYPVTVRSAASAAQALDETRKVPPSLVLLDYLLPDGTGIEVLQSILQEYPQAQVVLMSAYSTIQMAVEAIRLGALDVINKPFHLDQLEVVLQRALRVASLLAETRDRHVDLRERFHSPYLVGQSPPFLQAMHMASQVASTDATVLITGESGTGKELFARAIHANSRRAHRPFFPLNCSAIPDTLLESELFGYRRGAFTGADEDRPGILDRAAGGTVFLDEISETSPAFQTKLLRVLQNREFLPLGASALKHCDVRILVATNRPLEDWVETGRFRQDLFFRINGFEIHLPPLRERRQDVLILADNFLAEFAGEQRRTPLAFSEEAKRALVGYQWPGNVRELRNKVEMGCILCHTKHVQPGDLFPRRRGATLDLTEGLPFPFPEEGLSWESVERALLKASLARSRGNSCEAARLLRLSRATFRYRCRKHGIRAAEASKR